MMRMSETGVPASRSSVRSQAGYDGVRHSADLCARRNRPRRGSTRRQWTGCPPAATGPNVPRPTAGRRFHRRPRPDSTRLPQAALPLAIALDGDHRLGDPVDQLLFLLRGEDVLDDSTRRAHGTELHSFVVLCEPDGVAGQSAVHLILLDDLLAGVREAHGWRRAESRRGLPSPPPEPARRCADWREPSCFAANPMCIADHAA